MCFDTPGCIRTFPHTILICNRTSTAISIPVKSSWERIIPTPYYQPLLHHQYLGWNILINAYWRWFISTRSMPTKARGSTQWLSTAIIFQKLRLRWWMVDIVQWDWLLLVQTKAFRTGRTVIVIHLASKNTSFLSYDICTEVEWFETEKKKGTNDTEQTKAWNAHSSRQKLDRHSCFLGNRTFQTGDTASYKR